MPSKPKTNQQRLPRNTRAKRPPRFQLMPRDLELIRSILKHRFLYIEQLGWLMPLHTPRQLAHRLKLLYHGGFVERVKLPLSPSVNKLIYSMTEKGAQLLAESDGVGRDEIAWTRFHNQVTPSHIVHLLSVNDVLIAYEVALSAAKMSAEVGDFRLDRGEPTRNRITVEVRNSKGQCNEFGVVPDAILKVVFRENQHCLFFIEVDRGTMTSRRWQEKLTVYREFMKSPALLERFKTGSFIVLTLTTTERRLATLAEATVAIGGRRGFWYTTLDALSPSTAMNPIWVHASDLYELQREGVAKLAAPNETTRCKLADSVS